MMHPPQGAAIIVSVYYRQRTIQNTKQSIKQQEQKKGTLRQKYARSVTTDGIKFCHLFVFTSQKLEFMLQTANSKTENIFTTVLYFPTNAVCLYNKGAN